MSIENKAHDLKIADDILVQYTLPNSNIDNGNLFFAANEFKAALAAHKKALKVARDALEKLEYIRSYQHEENPEITAKELAETIYTIVKIDLAKIEEILTKENEDDKQ